ncbi:MAG: GreA/GreB family elongation factor [Actinomycetota bacterium]|nr:GreA/GreB family elongation factor [Actinomycetota bacterium]
MDIPHTAHPGSAITLRFANDPGAETFRLVDSGQHDADDTVSIDSPLGRALFGASAGDVVDVAAPSGPLAVTVLSVG